MDEKEEIKKLLKEYYGNFRSEHHIEEVVDFIEDNFLTIYQIYKPLIKL
jgi:hypothetical protein